MSNHPVTDPQVREQILSNPAPILADPDIMRALVRAEDADRGANVIDLRSVAMRQLEVRLDRLEETHRTVLAAAYDNLSGTNMVHRAILLMLEPTTFPDFLTALAGPVAETMRATSLRLVLETAEERDATTPGDLSDTLVLAAPGDCGAYVGPGGPVTLRQTGGGEVGMHGAAALRVRSEACLMLDLGEGRLPAMLVLGAQEADQFAPGQGTDLLAFFAGVLERSLRRFLT